MSDLDPASLPERKPAKLRFWADPQREAILRRMWAAGDSTTIIAVAVGDGCTKSAVIGAAQRLKLGPHPHAPGWPNSTRAVSAVKAKIRYNVYTKNKISLDVPLPAVIKDDDIPVAQRRMLLELTRTTCHWPVGDPLANDFYFCGGGTDGRTYCPGHERRAKT